MKKLLMFILLSFSLSAMDSPFVLPKKQSTNPGIKQALQELLDREEFFQFKELTENGKNLEAKEGMFGRTLLMKAAILSDTKAVELLVSAGANVNVTDDQGETPLMIAAGNARKEVIKLLIDAGADVNAQDKDGKTALMYAGKYGKKEAVKILLEYGADSRITDVAGQTALDVARLQGNQVIIDLLEHQKKKLE